MGKPLSISDQDCDVDLPCPVDDQSISDASKTLDGRQTTPLLATIHVVRSISQLSMTLRSPEISRPTLETFDRHFETCLATFPVCHQLGSDEYLDPRSLSPIVYLQNARFILHRHNISILCSPDLRYAAFNNCVLIAQQTARLLSRSMHDPLLTSPINAAASSGGSGSWQSLLASSASTMLCVHILRCLLMLLFREEFTSALVCVQAAKTIGNARTVNACCGRYVAFFLNRLVERYRRHDPTGIDRDEAMIAYVSADMQGTTDGAWIWQGSETGSQLESVVSPIAPPTGSAPPEGESSDAQLGRTADAPATATPTRQRDQEERERGRGQEWEGWDWVERTVQWFADEQQQRRARRVPENTRDTDSFSPSSNHSGTSGLVPSAMASPQATSSKSRMTIASII